jgi:uncharacterized protein (PEP-CTERM system associated)
MATTARRKADRATGAAWCTLACVALVPASAWAQNWRVLPSVSSQLTFTTNANLGDAESGRDTILEVRPSVAIQGEGGRVRLSGSASLNAVGYARDTNENELIPEVDLQGRVEAIERFFFIEAGYRAMQTSEDPFGARPGEGSYGNGLTTTGARLTPYVQGAAGPNLRYEVRSDNAWVREVGAERASPAAGYFGHHSAMVERDPQPFGWRLQADRNHTKYQDSAQPSLTLDEARAVLTYAVNESLTTGVRAGYERNDFGTEVQRDNIYGIEATWRPTERTVLDTFVENRFFGSGYRFAFDHRMPQLAWRILLSRGIDTSPQTLFELPPTQNVSSLLDAMFTTRYPDPVERARVVRDFIADRGLPTSVQQPTVLVDERLSIVTRHEAGLTLNGVRNTLSMSIYHMLTEDAVPDNPLSTGAAENNNVQRGVSAALTHRLGTSTNLTLSADWSRITAIDSVATGEETTEHSVALQLNLLAGPRTNAFVGGRYRKLVSNVSVDGHEYAAIVGVDHRF